MSSTDNQEPTASLTIVEAASSGSQLSTLAAAVAAANLVDTLASPGPFTLFAPTDAAFAKLPAGEVESLFAPENRARLASFVTHHILAGELTVAALRERAQAGDGPVTVRTVEGGSIQIEDVGERLQVTDCRSAQAVVTMSELLQSNGVIHLTDSVLSPSMW